MTDAEKLVLFDDAVGALAAVVAHIPAYILVPHPITERYEDGALVDGGIREFPRFISEVNRARAVLSKLPPNLTTKGKG